MPVFSAAEESRDVVAVEVHAEFVDLDHAVDRAVGDYRSMNLPRNRDVYDANDRQTDANMALPFPKPNRCIAGGASEADRGMSALKRAITLEFFD
jgi:hypothetical protein